VPFPEGTNDVIAAITRDFAVMHERLFGHVMDDDIEITTVRLRAVGLVDKPELPLHKARTSGEPSGYGQRTVYAFADEGSSYNLITRESLMAGDVIVGPAVIAEHTATTVMHEGDRLEVGSYGELVITIDYSKEA
jgi:N-methylhydantoinase A